MVLLTISKLYPQVTGISISAGVTEFDLENDNMSLFIERADSVLYKSKKTGRNRVTAV